MSGELKNFHGVIYNRPSGRGIVCVSTEQTSADGSCSTAANFYLEEVLGSDEYYEIDLRVVRKLPHKEGEALANHV